MANLVSYRAMLEAIQHTPPFRRYLQAMHGEPHDSHRLSAIEEFRKVMIGTLRNTLTPQTRRLGENIKRSMREGVEGLELDKAKRD